MHNLYFILEFRWWNFNLKPVAEIKIIKLLGCNKNIIYNL